MFALCDCCCFRHKIATLEVEPPVVAIEEPEEGEEEYVEKVVD